MMPLPWNDLLPEWEQSCARRMGKILALNHIEFDAKKRKFMIAHVVSHGAPPLKTREGKPVRIVALTFKYRSPPRKALH
jgi:hypothetical protein